MNLHRPSSRLDHENARRIPRILEKLEEDGLLRRCYVSAEASPVEKRYVLEVHTADYIEFIESLPLRSKELESYYQYLPKDNYERKDFVSSSGTRLAVFLAASAVVEACHQVAIGTYNSAFALVRPPGHHAKSSEAGGFCFFNNISIGAKYLQRKHGANKILVIDYDVHHGNGTQEIFYQDNTVLFCSVHRNDIYPNTDTKGHDRIGEGEGKGFNVNISLEHGLTNSDVLAVFEYLFVPLALEFRPDYILVSSGFDAAINDPLGFSQVTPSCFGELIRKLKKISGKIILALEGGYGLNELADSCAECVKELLNRESTDEVEHKCDDAHESTLKAIAEVKSILAEFWTIFHEDVKPPNDHTEEENIPPDLT